MGEFKPVASGDGSWAHNPGEETEVSTAGNPGPFGITDMPARAPAPKPRPAKNDRLLRGVPGAEAEE